MTQRDRARPGKRPARRKTTAAALGGAFVACAVLLGPMPARADTAAASADARRPDMARPKLSLADAVAQAKAHGFDVLEASVAIHGAEAEVRSAGQLPNPSLGVSGVRTLSCAGGMCDPTPYGINVSVADQGLLEGAISRKRALREAVARRGLDASKADRADVERILVAQVKTQYVQTAAAQLQLSFKRDVAVSLKRAVEINRVRYPRIIDEGVLARVEQEWLKAEQDVTRAQRDLRQQQIELLVMMGTRGALPEIEVDTDVLTARMPEALERLDRAALVREAIARRPDRRGALARQARADAALTLAKRQRVPDMTLSVFYQQQGAGAAAPQPATVGVGVGLPLPLFYQQQGEIRRAEADREAATIQRVRVEAAVGGDVEAAINSFAAAREIVTRYESALLERAKKARDITETIFNSGSDKATFTDMLDAQRSFVQVNGDYNAELVNYWTAVFQLEQALGKELVP